MSILKDLILVFTFITFLLIVVQYIKLKKETDMLKMRLTEALTHDLKTPTLAQLRGVEVLQKEFLGAMNPEQKELLEQIKSSCCYTLDMISMMLKTYNIKAKQTGFIETFSLSELLMECFAEVKYFADEKQLELVYIEALHSTMIEADRADIKTVILHLLQNAVVNSNRNEKIFVSIDLNSNSLKMEIKNKGVFSATSRFSAIGDGIKLDLSKKIIDSYHGTILTSREGSDTNKFMFTLPVRAWRNFNFT